MSTPNEFYSPTSRSFVSTTNGTSNGLMENNTMEASSNLEMTYENSLSSRCALPRQYFRYPLPVIPTTATASFAHSFLPSPFVPHYLTPPPLYYYHSSAAAAAAAYHESSLLQARYLPNRASPDSSASSPVEGKMHDPKWYSPAAAVQYHPPLPYYPPPFSSMGPTNPEHLQPYLPQCYMDPYAASHLAYSQSHASQPLLVSSDFPRSKVTEVFRPVSTSTPKFVEDSQSAMRESTEKLEDYSKSVISMEGNSVTHFHEQCTSTVEVGHPNPDSSMEGDSDERMKHHHHHRKGKRKACSETSSPRKRKELFDNSHEDTITDEGASRSGNNNNNVPSKTKSDTDNPSSCLKEESSYYKAELSSATTIVLRRSPQHNLSWESTLSQSKCQTLLRAGIRPGVSQSVHHHGSSITRNKTMLLKQKIFPSGVKPKGKRGRPRKYPTLDSKLTGDDSLRTKPRLFIGHYFKNSDNATPAIEEKSDKEKPKAESREQCTNTKEQEQPKHDSEPCILLEKIRTSPKKDCWNKCVPVSNSSEENRKKISAKSNESRDSHLEDNSESVVNQGSSEKIVEEPETCDVIAEEPVGIDLKSQIEDTQEIQIISPEKQEKENKGSIQEIPEVPKTSPSCIAQVQPKIKAEKPINAEAKFDMVVEKNKCSKIEVIDITDSKNEPAAKFDATAPSASRKVKKDSENAELTKKNIVFSTSSEKTLIRIPEKTLRLRVRGIDPVLNRKFKLKRDGPLFPKVPITYAEKKLEKIAVSRMQTWFLNKEQGETYLHRAAKENDPEVALYCLKFDGFHPRCTNNRGYTPLHEACKVGGVQVAKILLDNGAYHSQPAKGNIRPIHIASQVGNLELVELLLSLGANPFLTTVGGTNCFDLAESHQNVMKYLTEYFSLQPLVPSEKGPTSESSSGVTSYCSRNAEP